MGSPGASSKVLLNLWGEEKEIVMTGTRECVVFLLRLLVPICFQVPTPWTQWSSSLSFSVFLALGAVCEATQSLLLLICLSTS